MTEVGCADGQETLQHPEERLPPEVDSVGPES